MAPLGSLLAGLLAGRIGAPATIAGGGAVCIAAAAVFGSRIPSLKEEARAMILAQETLQTPFS